MIYVMSDLHGRFFEFMDMLKKINFKKEDALYIVGDVIDRRPNGIKLLNYIRKTENIHLIKGNHEQMMYDALIVQSKKEKDSEDILTFRDWIINGGEITLDEYKNLNDYEQEEILEYLRTLPDYKIINDINGNNFILIHAGYLIPEGKKVPGDIDIETLLNANIQSHIHLYIKEDFLDVKEKIDGYITVFGHISTEFIPEYTGYITKKMTKDNENRCKNNKIYKTKNKIGIDCGKKLGCLRLDDFKEFYIKNY